MKIWAKTSEFSEGKFHVDMSGTWVAGYRARDQFG